MTERYVQTDLFGEVPTPGEPIIPGPSLVQAVDELEHQMEDALENDGPAWKQTLEERYWEIRGVIRVIYAYGAHPEDVTLYEDRALPDIIGREIRNSEIPYYVQLAIHEGEAAEQFRRKECFTDLLFGDRTYHARVDRK